MCVCVHVAAIYMAGILVGLLLAIAKMTRPLWGPESNFEDEILFVAFKTFFLYLSKQQPVTGARALTHTEP